MKKQSSLHLSKTALAAVLVALAAATAGVADRGAVLTADGGLGFAGMPAPATAAARVDARHLADIAAMQQFRPGYVFWQDVFSIPDGSVVFGSAADGRRLAVVRDRRGLDREAIARRLEAASGPVIHNETRGTFASPGLREYGPLFAEWGAIYERFGVPRGIGLAQALLESGFIGTRRSEANAIGLCQFLASNWKILDRIDPSVIEIENQTTQAAYCAAYLTILATKYDSFIPALSDHHAGGTNVGRVLVNGERLGGKHARDQYFLGSDLAVGLRMISNGGYSDIYGSYGPRSYRYAEMVFANAPRIEDTIGRTPQARVYAMRALRALSLDEITRRTGLSKDDVRHFNPALAKKVPAGATLYLPSLDTTFGADVSFWHRDAAPAFATVLEEFLTLDVTPQEWESTRFAATLKQFERRFAQTGAEEGIVMSTMLSYVRRDAMGPRASILTTFRNSEKILDLFAQGVDEMESAAE